MAINWIGKTMPEATEQKEILKMASDVVAAYVGNNTMPADQVADVIKIVYNSLQTLSTGETEAPAERPEPAVSIRSSIKPDYIVCLEDGRKLKMLKRHLRASYDMSPEEYRARWGLAADYPMVAPNYAEQRSKFAKKIGLGRKPGASPKRRARKKA